MFMAVMERVGMWAAITAHNGNLSPFGHAMHALHGSCRSAVEQIDRHIAQSAFRRAAFSDRSDTKRYPFRSKTQTLI